MFQNPKNKTKLFHSKALQNLPELVFLVRKYSIWQPCFKPATKLKWIKKRNDGTAIFSTNFFSAFTFLVREDWRELQNKEELFPLPRDGQT
jgi:hypothetical protein